MQIDTAKMYDLIAGVFFTAFGVGLVVFREKIAMQAVKWNTKLWHFSGTDRQYQIAFIIGGAIFLIFGLLILFGIIHFRKYG